MNNIIPFTLMGEPIEIRADVVSVEKTSNSITIEYEDGFDRWVGFGAKIDILDIIANTAMISYRLGKYNKSLEEKEYLCDILERLKSTK